MVRTHRTKVPIKQSFRGERSFLISKTFCANLLLSKSCFAMFFAHVEPTDVGCIIEAHELRAGVKSGAKWVEGRP